MQGKGCLSPDGQGNSASVVYMYMSRISPRDKAKQGNCTRKQLFLFGEKMSCLRQDLYLHMYSTCTLCRHPHPHTHTHPLSGSTTMSLGLSRPRYTMTLLRDPSRAELSIRSLSGSVQYSLLCSHSQPHRGAQVGIYDNSLVTSLGERSTCTCI